MSQMWDELIASGLTGFQLSSPNVVSVCLNEHVGEQLSQLLHSRISCIRLWKVKIVLIDRNK